MPGPESALASFEELARTLSLAEADSLPPDATLRRGTLIAPRAVALPAPRSEPPRELREGTTLPRLEVSAAPDLERTADLELLRTLGRGGMGVVWLARQRSLAREVAVKRLHEPSSVPDTWSSRSTAALLAEARATGALEHPSIVPVHALGVDADGSPLLVMKRIEGASLDALIRDPDHAAWPELERRYGDRVAAKVEILMRVADALELAHSRGIVHRDVKPENVMVGSFGEVYLVDWGVALRLGELDDEDRAKIGIVGTPSFMAPEMVRGDARLIDARTDVYLLGATLHAALTGKARHDGTTLTAVLLSALTSSPVEYEAGVSAELGALANRATSADPADRPESARAFRAALADYLRHRSSARLAEEAQRRLDELTDGGAPTPARLAEPSATRALTESRFAFVQALREWSGNQPAREGLRATLRWMIEAELHRRSPDAAEALVRELDPPDEALVARIAELRAELAEARRLEDAARLEARERDPRTGAHQRALVAVALIAITIVLVALGWTSERAHGGAARPMSEILVYDATLFTVAASLIVIFRARLLANRHGRQTAATLLGVTIAAAVCDITTMIIGGDSRSGTPYAMLVMGCVLAGGAIGFQPSLAWSAAAFVSGAVASALWPALSIPAMGLAGMFAALVVLRDSLGHVERKS